MKKLVMVNVGFDDAYTGEKYVAGKVIELSEQRVAEVKEIDKNLISVVGNAEETPNETETALAVANQELEAANKEIEKLKKELEKATKLANK